MTPPGRTRSWWGWGWEDEALDEEQTKALADAVGARLGRDVDPRPPPSLAALRLPSSRLTPPPSLAKICRDDQRTRASHTYGKSFRDVVRAFHGDLLHPPDLVAYPRDESEVASLLDWCSSEQIAAIPYGGGSSVVGGVEADVGDLYRGAVTIDLSQLGHVLEIDKTSRAARIQAGVYGPDLEEQLRPHGYTLRHFPQSFEHSTLGGWIATRSGGHYATNYTHIDDFVEAVRVVSPAGIVQTRRLPGSGAGPSPDRLFLGSEGILGVITEAWVRLQDRPTWRASATVRFARWQDGVDAARAVAQAGLFPANCRLLDAGEAAASAGVTDGSAVLVLGFESADHPLDTWIARAVECCADHGGTVPEGVRATASEGTAGAWRSSFLRAPYGRDAMVALGCLADTFETAITWDRFAALHEAVMVGVPRVLEKVCGGGTVTCRFTHVYPDGCAPYFTVLAPSSHGSQVKQWDEVKAAASEIILASGGTITHHHAVGRDHRPWYDEQRPSLFASALRAAKHALDPQGILNPGVLIDPVR
jgi:alkyldihydroxyacetonephosphate synthase